MHLLNVLHNVWYIFLQCALAPYKDLPQEIESLKTVLEMRNEEINKLRSQNVELQKKVRQNCR